LRIVTAEDVEEQECFPIVELDAEGIVRGFAIGLGTTWAFPDGDAVITMIN
jgi:hypothetical protein